MSRQAIDARNKPWFVETQREALDIFLKTEDHPIASPIFAVEEGYKFGLENEEEFKKKFPFQQKISGNGACYFNACLAGILNKCVGDKDRWNQFRENLINYLNENFGYNSEDINEFINQIGVKDEVLTRKKVNNILQVRGDDNIVVIMSKLFLLPLQEQLLADIKKQKSDEEEYLNKRLQYQEPDDNETRKNNEEIATNLLKIDELLEQSNLYNTGGSLATSYFQEHVQPIIDNLSSDLGINFHTITTEGANKNQNTSIYDNENTVFLWNPDGNTHFDLLYSHADLMLSREIQQLYDEVPQINVWKFAGVTETIQPELKPNTEIEVTLVTPIVNNVKSVWMNDDRGNKFRVIDGVYVEEGQNKQIDVGQTFIGILQKVAKESALNHNQILEIIEFAKQRGGVSSQYNQTSQRYENNDYHSELTSVTKEQAKLFSKRFQQECEKCGIYTGREGENVKMVGLRLTFIPDDVVNAFEHENDMPDFTQKVEDIQSEVQNILLSKDNDYDLGSEVSY